MPNLLLGRTYIREAVIALFVLSLLEFVVEVGLAQHSKNVSKKKPDATVTVATKFAYDSLSAGMTSSALIMVAIKDGWHINSPNPADESLVGTSINISQNAVFDSTSVSFFPGIEKKFDYADSPTEVFEGSTAVLIRFTVASNINPGKYTVPAVLNYQACSENVCLATTSIQFSIPILVASRAFKAHRINTELFDQYDPQPK
jgi:thioredoxin:protein disulfide reductase